MDEEAVFVTVTDDEGNTFELEYIDSLEYNGQEYRAFFPTLEEGQDEDSEEMGLILLKVIQEDGEELLATIDDDQELEAVYQEFLEVLFEDEEDTED